MVLHFFISSLCPSVLSLFLFHAHYYVAFACLDYLGLIFFLIHCNEIQTSLSRQIINLAVTTFSIHASQQFFLDVYINIISLKSSLSQIILSEILLKSQPC